MARATVIIECGQTSGLGRVRRTLTLAAALEVQGFDITVVLSSMEGKSLVEALGFEARLDMPTDLSDDLVVIDTCSQSALEINKICCASRVSLVIDDLAERPVVCDYLVNPNLYAHGLDYSAYTIGRAFLGSDFTLVDQRFFRAAKSERDRKGIVVSFGGTDNGTLALPVIKALLERTDMPVFLPVPDYVEPISALDALVRAESSVHLIRAADMPSLLGASKVFLGAAGATVLEALAAGCRVCATATQPDQHKNVAYLPRVGVMSSEVYDPEILADMAVTALKDTAIAVPLNSCAAYNIATTISSHI
ncbi:hypothetical protein [Kordiimonas pumila]|uniref:Glycosyl transferase family 28 C-terminal domain-containing protein n=1 Tax=Kordiimonas pumila TaxID=2161677 RepID=A0ABV7D069_9PROT|nr:hypothetical protein [Kordiimonas pumila]